ncbi:MAG: hypothetical protein V5A55_02615 [Halovenus sp.]
MAALDWHVRRHDGVALVELVVTSDTAERVRVESALEPVWPPRRQGRPVAGWTDNTYEGTVSPTDRLVLGFASPAPPAEQPARIVETSPGDPEESEVTARAVVRALGEQAPPRDAVPTCEPANDREVDDTVSPQQRRESPDGSPSSVATRDAPSVDTGPAAAATQSVEAWFDAVESRADTATRLDSVTAAEEARATIEALGGIEAVRDLKSQLEADRRQLDAVRDRHRSLAERLDGVDLPLATLERLS